MSRSFLTFCSIICLSAMNGYAQPGSIDPTFNPGGSGANGDIHGILLQPDQKILIHGEFAQYNGTPVTHLTRLDVNGTLDNTFQNNGLNGIVRRVRVMDDGKIMVAGLFTTVDGISRKYVARLLSNGSVDTSFDANYAMDNTGWAFGLYISGLDVDSNGNVIFAFRPSAFTVPVPQYPNVFRLLPTGQQDPTFMPAKALDTYGIPAITEVNIRPDGKIVLSGDFSSSNGSPADDIVILNADGSRINGQAPFTYPEPNVVIPLSNDHILVGLNGSYTSTSQRCRRLDLNGAQDLSFNPNGTGPQGDAKAIAVGHDGTIFIMGDFISYNGVARDGAAMLHEDGTLNTNYVPLPYGAAGIDAPFAAAIDGSSRPILAGFLTSYGGTSVGHIVRIQNCIPGATCDDGDPNTPIDILGADCICASAPVELSMKVMLQGADIPNQPLMHQVLRQFGLVPLAEPYTALPNFTHAGDGGGETTTADVLSTASGNNIVDWVFLQLRDSSDSTMVLHTRSALLKNDGSVVDIDGNSPVTFGGAVSGSYYVSVRHRNHLGAMTAAPVHFGDGVEVIDITDASTAVWGVEPMVLIDGAWHLWGGDINSDGKIKYTGPDNDRDPILVKIGGSIPTNTIIGYFSEDMNMNHQVKYTGGNNDRDPILVNIGGSIPTAVRLEQLP